jgi:DNA polymerase III epsilon subunit-like protein
LAKGNPMTIIRVLDLESTGLAPPEAKICEWASFDLIDGTGRGRMAGSLCNPGISMPPEAQAVHHISDDDVASKPSFEDQYNEITSGDPDVWCAFFMKFDRQFFDPPGAKWICGYKLALWLWPEAPGHKNQILRYWLKLKLADPMGAVPHRAYGDAYVTTAILRRALRGKPLVMDYKRRFGSDTILAFSQGQGLDRHGARDQGPFECGASLLLFCSRPSHGGRELRLFRA